MKCITCSADIPPAFVSAIAKNICPGCDGPIMSETAKTLMSELKEAMSRMPNDPEGLAGWIVSNYELTKIGDAQPTEFHRKPDVSRKIDHDIKIKKNDISDFMKRANVDPALIKNSKNQRLAALASAIASGEADDTEYVESESDYSEQNYDNEYEDQEDLYEKRNRIRSQIRRPQQRSAMAESMIVGEGSPLSPEETAMMMEQIAQTKVGEIDNSSAFLQAERLKRLQKQEIITQYNKKHQF